MDPFWMLSKPYFNHLFWVNYLGLFCFRELHLPTMTLDSWGEGFSVIEKLIRLAEAGHRFQLCRRCSLSLPNLELANLTQPNSKFLGPKFFVIQIFLGWNLFWTQIFSGPKFIGTRIFEDPNFMGPKFFGTQIFWDPNSFWPSTI